MRLKDKTSLRDLLNHANYFNIAVWNDGTWTELGNHFDIKSYEDKPIYFITRPHNGEMTHKAINELFRRLEIMMLGE